MKRKWEKLYIGFRVQIRLLRLRFLYLPKPDDAKSDQEMLEEIKKRLELT